MGRPKFTPEQNALQASLLAKFEEGSRREVRETLNGLKVEYGSALKAMVVAMRSETDGRKLRKLEREAGEARKMLQTLANVKRRMKTITAGEAKRIGSRKAKVEKLIAKDAAKAVEATQAPASEAAPVAVATPAPEVSTSALTAPEAQAAPAPVAA